MPEMRNEEERNAMRLAQEEAALHSFTGKAAEAARALREVSKLVVLASKSKKGHTM